MRNNIKASMLMAVITLTLSGCGVTIATVAGVSAYEMYKAPTNSRQITKDLNHQLPHDYFAIALLNENIVLAGQVESATDIEQAKAYISKKLPNYTIYSYLEIGHIESGTAQSVDLAISSKVSQFLTENVKKGISSTVANGKVYLLANSLQEKPELARLSNNILQFENVRSVITIQERK